MCKICPECGAIAEFNAYYGRTACTRCEWEGGEELKAMIKVEPCPHCGSASYEYNNGFFSFVSCQNCGCRTRDFYRSDSEEPDGYIRKAIETWNKRI